jgi:DnaK suppressor protein
VEECSTKAADPPPAFRGRAGGGWRATRKAGYNSQFPAARLKRRGGSDRQDWPREEAPPTTDGSEDMAAKTATAVKKPRELTEEEILKAPDKDYMNDAQLAFFKKKLLEVRDQILRNADDTGEHLRENEITTDPSDRATLEEEYTLELRTRDRERKLLKKVEKSLRMIEDGTYGYCEETGEPIGVPRLIARPMTTLSIEAQERRERVQKLYGD